MALEQGEWKEMCHLGIWGCGNFGIKESYTLSVDLQWAWAAEGLEGTACGRLYKRGSGAGEEEYGRCHMVTRADRLISECV